MSGRRLDVAAVTSRASRQSKNHEPGLWKFTLEVTHRVLMLGLTHGDHVSHKWSLTAVASNAMHLSLESKKYISLLMAAMLPEVIDQLFVAPHARTALRADEMTMCDKP